MGDLTLSPSWKGRLVGHLRGQDLGLVLTILWGQQALHVAGVCMIQIISTEESVIGRAAAAYDLLLLFLLVSKQNDYGNQTLSIFSYNSHLHIEQMYFGHLEGNVYLKHEIIKKHKIKSAYR